MYVLNIEKIPVFKFYKLQNTIFILYINSHATIFSVSEIPALSKSLISLQAISQMDLPHSSEYVIIYHNLISDILLPHLAAKMSAHHGRGLHYWSENI